MLEYAQAYAAKGWPVIPVEAKTPVVKWREFQERLPTENELKEWFTGTRYNIAVVTGAISGISVVDCDSQEAVDHYYMTANPSGLSVKTHRGFHFYHEYTPGRNISRDGIDVRNDGGICTLPPSIHKSGQVYQWENEGPMTKYNPEWFEETRVQIANTVAHIETETGLEALERCRRYISRIEGAVSGQGGHNKTFRVACKIAEFMQPYMTAEQAMPLMREYNERCEPIWAEHDLLHKLTDAFGREK